MTYLIKLVHFNDIAVTVVLVVADDATLVINKLNSQTQVICIYKSVTNFSGVFLGK